MPPKSNESLPTVPTIEPLAKMGFLILALDRKLDEVSAAKPSITHPSRKRYVLDLADEFIDSARDAAGLDRLPGVEVPSLGEDLLTEINLMARGISERESMAIQDIGLYEVKGRKRRVKALLGTRTKYDTAVEAIQRGFVPFEPAKLPTTERLTPIEEAVLLLTARGWTAKEIGQKYTLTQNTIDRYFEVLRTKFGAKNMAHVMLRSFEAGVFRLGEEIPDPDKKYEGLGIKLNGKDIKPADMVHPNELEFLRLVGLNGHSSFTQEDIISRGFYLQGGDSENSAFGHMVMRVKAKLEISAGQQVLERRRIRTGNGRTRLFFFTLPVSIGMNEEWNNIPAFVEEIKPPKVKTRKSGRAPKKLGQSKAQPPLQDPASSPQPTQQLRESKPYPHDPTTELGLIGIRPIARLEEQRKEVLGCSSTPALVTLLRAIDDQIAVLKARG